MAQLLQAPISGYEDAIIIPEIVATNFKLKHGLINLVQNKQFFGHEKEDPHAHSIVTGQEKPILTQTSSPTPAPIKAVKPNCVTCGDNHAYQNCPETSRNVYQDNIEEYVSQAATANYGQGNTGFRPQMVANQIRPPGFPPVQNTQNNFNRGNNFNQNRGSGTLPGNTVTNPKEDLKDVKVKVGMFHFPADFVVIDFEPDPRPSLIISTPSDDPIVSTTSLKLTPFGDSNFLLFEEADAFLGLEDDPDSPELDPSYYNPKKDILSLEAILNSDPSPPLSNHAQSVPSFKEELKACEAKTIKSSIDEPPEVELKDLPTHLEYAFLEGDNKLPVIIAKAL
nr:hypothetical protein [Tanacetum cinerariifolium]